MNISRSKKVFLAVTLGALGACSSDSTGPGTVGAEEALRSLSLGLGSGSGAGLPFALSPSALGTAARGIDLINVGIDGATESMYALGLRVTYPTGTCLESLFIIPPSPWYPAGECTPPPLGLVLVLWQTTAGSRPPQRMVVISADVGTTHFDFVGPQFDIVGEAPGDGEFSPAFAFYINDRREFWASVGGSLNSQVAATNQTCSVPPPPFAKTSTCHVATFDEAGQITFERFDFAAFGPGAAPPRQTMDFVIPRQTIRGILQAITEISPVTLPAR